MPHLDTLETKMIMTGMAAIRQTIAGNDMHLCKKGIFVMEKIE